MKKFLLPTFCTLTMVSVNALADSFNNENFVTVNQISTWPGRADIVLAEPHKCKWKHKNVYLLKHSSDNKDFNAHFSVLTAAMMGSGKVKLNYTCDKEGMPIVNAVRVKPA